MKKPTRGALLVSLILIVGIVGVHSSWHVPSWAKPVSSSPIVTDFLADDVIPLDFGMTTYTFTIEYSDLAGIAVASIDANDVIVRDPSSTPLTVISGAETPPTGLNGSPRTALYTVTPPGGAWDSGDVGTYTIELVDNQVFNISGAPVAGANPLTFFAVLDFPGAVLEDKVLTIVGTNEDDQVHVNQAGPEVKVHTDFASGSPLTFPLTDINQIVMFLAAGNDHASIASTVKLPTVVHGDEGDDILNGGGGPSVLEGGPGNDILNGGNINDILIGGDGADRANGTKGDDILIGGTTDHDTNDDALLALLEEWNSGEDYNTRVANIRTGSGVVGGSMLEKGTTVLDDGARDRLTGSTGRDWFLFSPDEDKTTDKKGTEEEQ